MATEKREKPASEIETGEVVRDAGALWRVVAADHQRGIGKAAGVSRLKLRGLETDQVSERRCKPDERIEVLSFETAPCEFLYAEAGRSTFMHAATFEQFELNDRMLGPFRRFLRPNQTVDVQFHDGNPVAVLAPAFVVLVVAATPPGQRGDTEAGFKPATLENGLEVQVPPFIAEGDRVRIEVEGGRYVERVRDTSGG